MLTHGGSGETLRHFRAATSGSGQAFLNYNAEPIVNFETAQSSDL
jgi:hypothetical protein